MNTGASVHFVCGCTKDGEGWMDGNVACSCDDLCRLPMDGGSGQYYNISDERPQMGDEFTNGNAKDVFMAEVFAANMGNCLVNKNAREVLITEVPPASMVDVTDTSVSEDVYLGDGFSGVHLNEKRLCFFGDGESLPIDADSEEYAVIPDGHPNLWYSRYCVDDDLTPECEALKKNAENFYNEKMRLRSLLEVKVDQFDAAEDIGDSDTAQESESVVRRKAEWFSKIDMVAAQRGAGRSAAAQSLTNKKGRDRQCKVIPGVISEFAGSHSLKRGRGRPPKQVEVCLTVKKRGRGRPPKQLEQPLIPQKRGRGRLPKQTSAASVVKSVGVAKKRKKCAQQRDVGVIQFSTLQFCGKCCQKITKKSGQDVRGSVLHFEIVREAMANADEVVKRPRGRPRKA